jgi:hypothetical protein
MQQEYTVRMTHHMRSVVTVYVPAGDIEAAKEAAISASFCEKECWEEEDTDYDYVQAGTEMPEDDERLLSDG